MLSAAVASGDQATAAQYNNMRTDLVASLSELCNGRLTATSGTPFNTGSALGFTTVYFSPYLGCGVSLYNGSEWGSFAFAELSIGLTQSQSGTYTNSTGVLSGLTSTAQLTVGMKVVKTAGSGVLGTTPTIATIDSSTQVTLTPTGGTTGAITVNFYIPQDKNVDIFLYNNSGTLRLEFGPLWYSDLARFSSGTYQTLLPRQNGIPVKTTNGTTLDTARRYLGTVRAKADGSSDWSANYRSIYNMYNPLPHTLTAFINTANYTSASATWVAGNADTTIGSGRFGIVNGDNLFLAVNRKDMVSNSSGVNATAIGIGINQTTGNDAQEVQQFYGSTVGGVSATYNGFLATGYSYVQQVVKVDGGTGTYRPAGGISVHYMLGIANL
jgi:hypothetical protein